MSDLGDAAARVGDKITELLDVFDLSFFMSGALSMAAILMMLPEDVPNPVRGDDLPGTAIFGLVLGSYVLGLLCFALGRPLRGRVGLRVWGWVKHGANALRRRPREVVVVEHERVRATLRAQGLRGAELRTYFGHDPDTANEDALKALYTRMWVHVRSYSPLSESFALLKRYWMLSAAYDGVAVAVLLWLIPIWYVFGATRPLYLNPWLLSAAAVCMALACWHRAQQYKHYQIEELVATVAHWLSLLGRKELESPGDPAQSIGADARPIDQEPHAPLEG